MDLTSVTVFIPSFQQPELLQRCVDAVLNCISARIVILDDSFDNSVKDEVEKIRHTWETEQIDFFGRLAQKERISHISSWNRYKGIINNNTALSREFINIRHHDDHLIRHHSKNISLDFRKVSECRLIIHPIVTQHGKIGKVRFYRYHCTPGLLRLLVKHLPPELLFIFNYIGPTACVWVRSDLVGDAPVFDEQLEWLVDVFWYYSLMKRCMKSQIRVSEGGLNITEVNMHSITRKLRPNIGEIAKKERQYISKTIKLSAWLYLMAAVLRALNKILSLMWLKSSVYDV